MVQRLNRSLDNTFFLFLDDFDLEELAVVVAAGGVVPSPGPPVGLVMGDGVVGVEGGVCTK